MKVTPATLSQKDWTTNSRRPSFLTDKLHKLKTNLLKIGNTDDWGTWIQIFLVSQWDGHYALCTKGNMFHPPTSTSGMPTMTNRFNLKNCIPQRFIWWLPWLCWSWWQQQWQQKWWQRHKVPQCCPSNSTHFPVCRTTCPLTRCKLCLYPQHY